MKEFKALFMRTHTISYPILNAEQKKSYRQLYSQNSYKAKKKGGGGGNSVAANYSIESGKGGEFFLPIRSFHCYTLPHI